MRNTEKHKISHYSMKLRLYPSKEQQEKINKVLQALRVAYNITFHEVFLLNPDVCRENKDGLYWPDFHKMTKKEWRAFLISQNPCVADAPAASIMGQSGILFKDGKKAWQTGMRNRPISPELRSDFHFYGNNKPRQSFNVQILPKKFEVSPANSKVAWITVPKIGRIKARGVNTKLWFGENGALTLPEAIENNVIKNPLSVTVSIDRCNDYYVTVLFYSGKKEDLPIYIEKPVSEHTEPIGINIGVQDIAVLSNGERIQNKKFKNEKQQTLSKLNKELSRRWGPANKSFRDYNSYIRSENKKSSELGVELLQPLAQPSNRYLKSKLRKALIERKISRRRNTYYHQKTSSIVQSSNMIAIKTLHVSNIMKMHRNSYELADAALSDFISKLSYKAERYNIPICCIGVFEEVERKCISCGEVNPQIKDLRSVNWVCPKCGTYNGKVSTAKNILNIAFEKGGVEDKILSDTELNSIQEENKQEESKKKQKKEGFIKGRPEIIVSFSKELTHINDPRYVVKNTKTGKIIDDAQGYGYRSITNAEKAFRAKMLHSISRK